MASRVLVKKIKMRVPAGKATAAPPVGPALGARTRPSTVDLVAEQLDSLNDAIIPHSTGPSTPTEVKGPTTESELRLSVAGQAGVNLMDFCSTPGLQSVRRAGAGCEAARLHRSDI